MNPLSALTRSWIFQIESEHVEVHRRVRLLQILSLFLAAVSLTWTITFLPSAPDSANRLRWILPIHLILIPSITLISLLFGHYGYPRRATHTFFSAFNAIALSYYFVDPSFTAVPFFLLISIVAVVFLDRLLASLIYAVGTLLAGAAFYFLSPTFAMDHMAAFTVTTLGVSVTAWVTANNLNQRTRSLHHQTEQLQRSAHISRLTSAQLQLNELLQETVTSIVDHFEFYFVAIYLLNEASRSLDLREATGPVGATFKAEGYQLPLDDTSIVTWTASQRSPQIVLDVDQDPHYKHENQLPDTRSEAAFPLIARGDLLGVLDVQSRHDDAFDEQSVTILRVLAHQIAINIDNAHLFAQTQDRVGELSVLYRLSNALSQAPSLPDIFTGVRREIFTLVDAVGLSISLLTEDGEKLDWIYGFEYGSEVDLSTIPPLSINEGFSGHVARTRQLLHITGDMDEAHDKYQSRTVGETPGNWLGLPMIVANQLIGVLAVENERPFTDHEIDILTTIAGSLAIAIHNLIQFERVQEALATQSMQRLQLETAAQIAAVTTSILDLEELLQHAVDLIKERFDLYYVGLFLVDDQSNDAVLQAATGEAGRQQIGAGHRLRVGGRSLIGGATDDGEPRIIQDVTADEEWLPNPHLPQTRAELALPLRVRGQIIGALTVQSSRVGFFTTALIGTLQTMSDQLAIAIQNAQLLTGAELRARQQEALHQISGHMHRSNDANEIIRIGLRALSDHLDGRDLSLSLGRMEGQTDSTQARSPHTTTQQ